MARTSPRQRRTSGRVMHEFKHGELRSGPGGKGGKVKSRRQAIAIALKEAGASKYESKRKNRANFAKTRRKETAGKTAQQEREGAGSIGASGRRRAGSSKRTTNRAKSGRKQGRESGSERGRRA